MKKNTSKMNILFLLLCVLGSTSSYAQQADVPLVNTDNFVEYAPAVSADGKYMVFQSNRNKGFKLYETSKVNGVWLDAKPIEVINDYQRRDLSIIGSPFLSADANTLLYSAWHNDTYGDLDLYYSVRKNGSWSKPEHFGNVVNSALPETSPSLNPSGDTLLFVRKGTDQLNPNCGRIFISTKDSDGKWSAATPLASTQSACYNRAQQAYVSGYYFAEGNNKQELITAEGADAKRGQSVNTYLATLKPLAKTPWITAKEDYLIYASNGDIKAVPLPYDVHIKGASFVGKVKDAEKKHAIGEVQFSVVDSIHKESAQLSNQADGSYALYVPAAYTYRVMITANKYDTLYKTYSVPAGDWFKIVNEDILLQPRKKKMIFKVSDEESGKNLKVKVKVINKNTGEEIILDESMQQDGRYTVHLREGDEYSVEVNNVEGYAFTKKNISTGDEDFSIPVTKIKQGSSVEVKDIFFDFNSYKLSEGSYKELDKLVDWMKTNKKVIVQIEAHTDDVGSDEFNLNLSDKRAHEIVRYLTRKGISSSRMKAKGYGKSKPRAEGDSEEARAQNRRVELKVL